MPKAIVTFEDTPNGQSTKISIFFEPALPESAHLNDLSKAQKLGYALYEAAIPEGAVKVTEACQEPAQPTESPSMQAITESFEEQFHGDKT